LVRAAADVFREKGYTGSRVQDISRRAGFTSGALYSHFDSRAALLAEAIAVENDRLLREMSDGLGDLDSSVTAEIATALSDFVALDFSPTDQLLLDGLAICAREPGAKERIGEALRRLTEQLRTRLASTPARDGSHLATDPASVSFLMVVFLAGATAVRAAGLQDTAPDNLEEILAGLLGHLGALDPAEAPAS
jgi:AcrR family transcriptional regulator